MSRKTRMIAGLVFFIAAVAAVTMFRIRPENVNPTQSTESKQAGILITTGKGMIITQEVRAAKDYLTGISLVFTHGGRSNTNRNVLLVLDTSYTILYKHEFPSAGLKEGDYNVFSFSEALQIGKGNTFLLSLYSPDGTENNAASPLMNMTDSVGLFKASQLNTDDITGSARSTLVRYRGSLMFKTFETDQSQFWLARIWLYICVLLVTALILWSDRLGRRLVKFRPRVEYAYLAIALPASLAFLVITPPFQVPDEGTHYKLSYNISEMGFLQVNKTFPTSIANLDTTFMHLRFLAGKKTTPAEVQSHFGVKINPGDRTVLLATDYTLPYLPQAIGITVGKIFTSSALSLLYFGRTFNMIIAIMVMFFAIRMVPAPFRLMFLLLALMPKTVFLFGSLSYDSLTISLSFLAIAVFFHYAHIVERDLTYKDLVLMAIPVGLLLLCKPPYFLLGTLFFIIPPKRFGKLYRYIWIAIGAVFLVVMVWKGVPAIRSFLDRPDKAATTVITPGNFNPASDSLSDDQPLYRPDEQMNNIMADIPAYLELIYKSGFVYYREYLVKSFVGVLGYIDVELPDLLTYSYLALILLTGFAIASGRIRITLSQRALFVILLIITYVLVETAMYLYATRPGRDRVFGVQGRYFIPMAPLFFMLFYNGFIHGWLNPKFSLRKREYDQAKPKMKPPILEDIRENEQLFDKYLYLALFIYCVFALVFSIYLTAERYYI